MSRTSLSLEGKTAVVTGGGTGIGRAIALELASNGADVVVASRRPAVLKQVSEEIEALGRRSLAVQADVSIMSDVERLAQRTMDEFGAIDILINNAGLANPSGSTDGSYSQETSDFIHQAEDHWIKVMDVDLNGVARCCQAVGKRMIERKTGVIVNISSAAAFDGSAHPYGIAKAGVIRLTTGVARELAPHNIRVNAIAPGWVRVEPGAVISEAEFAAFDDPETSLVILAELERQCGLEVSKRSNPSSARASRV